MIEIENVKVLGWEAAIRGMRNPMNSWEKSDSGYSNISGVHAIIDGGELHQDQKDRVYCIGFNDHDLMMRLRNAGTDHRKFMRMITVYLDITAPLYW